MDTSFAAVSQTRTVQTAVSSIETPRLIPREMNVKLPVDSVQFGQNGSVSNEQAMGIVLERAMDKLRSVVSQARAELGIPEGQEIDTSPEATGNRIADFAISAFSAWRKNNADVPEEDAKKEFASFIGGAVQKGISEARSILKALNALSGDVDKNIDSTWTQVQKRLDNFVAGKE